MPSDSVKKIIDHIWRNTEENPFLNIYAILDAARDERIYARLIESDMTDACLFSGGRAKELATVAPYFIHLNPDDELTQWLFETGWGKSWGIFVESTADFEDLKRHFQSLVTVYDEAGKPLFFRYYDPRVLRVYLPTCNESELKQVFGQVSQYFFEDENSLDIVRYAFAQGELVTYPMKLSVY